MLPINNERIRILSSEFHNIEEMIAELSKYTRLTSEDYIPEPSVFDTNSIIDEAVQSFEIKAANKKQLINFNKPRTENIVESDKSGFIRVLNNLIINAVNNAPDNSEIKISESHRTNIITGSDLLTIEIENEGKIEERDIQNIITGSGLNRVFITHITDFQAGHCLPAE